MRKKRKKDKNYNINQSSFYFEDFLESNKKNKIYQKNNFYQDRIYLLFFLFCSLIFIFSIKIFSISLSKIEILAHENESRKFPLLRRDIVDRNGALISRNIKFYHAAVNPKLVSNNSPILFKL